MRCESRLPTASCSAPHIHSLALGLLHFILPSLSHSSALGTVANVGGRGAPAPGAKLEGVLEWPPTLVEPMIQHHCDVRAPK